MRLSIYLVILFALVMCSSCSGKTTVRDEMVDKTPRVEKPSENPAETPAPPVTEQPVEENTEEKPAPRPAPGQDDGSRKPVPISPTPGDNQPDNRGGKEQRDNYMNREVSYPGATEQSLGFAPPMSPSRSGKTLLTTDLPEQVSEWYQNKFAGNATVTTRNAGDSPEIHISINDSANGYTSNVIVSRYSAQGQTNIVIQVEDS